MENRRRSAASCSGPTGLHDPTEGRFNDIPVFLEPGAPSPPLKIVVQRIAAKQKQRPVPRGAIALSPTKRKRTAPVKPGKWAKPRITSNIQLAPLRAVENLPEQPIDLTVED